jgi:hypothetical protein
MKWYTYLKTNEEKQGKALLDYETLEEDNIIICQKLEFLSFGRFNNYLDFAKHMLKGTSVENRCFYETIFGNKPQRPYFDIEFYTEPHETDFWLPEEEADESVRKLTTFIIEELNEIVQLPAPENALQHNKSHILVFTSHAGPKRSYHVVVEGYSVSDYKQNKEFHDRVMKRMPEKWRNIVDHSMYKSIQQFRIVGNTKWKSNRYKTLSDELTVNYKLRNKWIPRVMPESPEHKFIILLENSLITMTSVCTILPNLIKDEPKARFLPSGHTGEAGESFYNPLTPTDIREALALCYKFAGLEFGDPKFPYSYLKTVESGETSALILLKRHRPSNCAICKRVHENENPYLIIAGETRDVYLDCRRNIDNKKLHVGNLGPIIKFGPTGPSDCIPTVKAPVGPSLVKPPTPKQSFNIDDFINTSSKVQSYKAPVKSEPKKELLRFTF